MSHIGKEGASTGRHHTIYGKKRWVVEEQLQENIISAYPDLGKIIDKALVTAFVVLGTGMGLGVAAEFVTRYMQLP